ncbi:hypothetical protein J1605_007063 [Eschrichtius robustus]|uniref:C2H2-type domain-containing protein n=1 Tax=Eschrichtius robustus TaxID=9764 RepID=A0AB34H316_ESCRO|nr:hypothetical protein J1605_007063 [Eschrichtius robustus]
MSPLECSECFGDQLLHRTYTWHLTLHSRPNFTRKGDIRSESLEIPINVVLPQVGIITEGCNLSVLARIALLFRNSSRMS